MTAEFMFEHGVNKVQGAQFINVEVYTLDHLDMLRQSLAHFLNKDFGDVETKLKRELPPPSCNFCDIYLACEGL